MQTETTTTNQFVRRERRLLGIVGQSIAHSYPDYYCQEVIESVVAEFSPREEGAARRELERIRHLSYIRSTRRSVPNVRDWIRQTMSNRWTNLVSTLIPDSRGAGTHGAAVLVSDKISVPHTVYASSRDWDNTLPNSYRYPVANSTAMVYIPRGWEIADESGVIVARPYSRRAGGIRYRISQRGAYGLRMTPGYCYHGRHVDGQDPRRARRAAAKLVLAARAAAAKVRAADEAKRTALARSAQIWLTADRARAAGNCLPGVSAWAERLGRWLGADGEIGAIRGDLALEYARATGDQVDRVEEVVLSIVAA